LANSSIAQKKGALFVSHDKSKSIFNINFLPFISGSILV